MLHSGRLQWGSTLKSALETCWDFPFSPFFLRFISTWKKLSWPYCLCTYRNPLDGLTSQRHKKCLSWLCSYRLCEERQLDRGQRPYKYPKINKGKKKSLEEWNLRNCNQQTKHLTREVWLRSPLLIFWKDLANSWRRGKGGREEDKDNISKTQSALRSQSVIAAIGAHHLLST